MEENLKSTSDVPICNAFGEAFVIIVYWGGIPWDDTTGFTLVLASVNELII